MHTEATIAVLSGKGGTGKTTVASAFIKLSDARAYADCDVDAPNLHLVMGTYGQEQKKDYMGLPKAVIDPDMCISCNKCFEVCRFDAIKPGNPYEVIPIACEGCNYCIHVCPVEAIHSEEAKVGDLKLLKRKDEVFSTATLLMGRGTTGKLVSEVKNQLKEVSNEHDVAILDGSPGIGCPVTASLSGVSLALMVAEPSVSGLADLKRVLASARQLQVPVAVIVNKHDSNECKSAEIEVYCYKEGVPFLGKIPYDKRALEAINSNRTLVEMNSKGAEAIKTIYEKTLRLMKERIHT
jgi:MinD superfamily P-loop ATPase